MVSVAVRRRLRKPDEKYTSSLVVGFFMGVVVPVSYLFLLNF